MSQLTYHVCKADNTVEKAVLTLPELSGPLEWYWLSFADPDLPEGSQFLGAAAVVARGPYGAVVASYAFRINPGGEVLILHATGWWPPEGMDHRLLTRAEAKALL